MDFVIRKRNKIQVIEAESSGSSSIKSLKRVRNIYGKSIGDLIVLHSGDIKHGGKETDDEGIMYYPYYVASVL